MSGSRLDFYEVVFDQKVETFINCHKEAFNYFCLLLLHLMILLKDLKSFSQAVGEMLDQLHMAKADNSYYKKLQDYLAPDLLVLDELGFKALPHYAADDFYERVLHYYYQ